ncbi:hypothetical protein [Nocardia alni]|uniref:hypothetical protein n=1 Tax=Nocardia alni TaxID=2815723 RepID=UPI0020B426DF|nr:hypothetical protein [Nocardia alni]
MRLAELRRLIAAVPARGADARMPPVWRHAQTRSEETRESSAPPSEGASGRLSGDSSEQSRAQAMPRRCDASDEADGESPMRMRALDSSGQGQGRGEPWSGGGKLLPVPPALAGLLPVGGLVRGSVVEYSGASSLLIGLLAAVTGDGGHAVAVGLPRLGLLAAAEMGARLDRLAVVPDPGPDPLEIASVLLDGLDLVVLGLRGATVPSARTRVLTARARTKGATLVVTGGSWSGPALRIEARVAGYGGLGRGCGRLRTMRLDVRVRDRSSAHRTGLIDLMPGGDGVEWTVAQPDSTVSPIVDANHAAS